MRLRSFSAPTMQEAMTLVRLELGPDAIIVATQKVRNGYGARVTAAVEPQQEIVAAAQAEIDAAETPGECLPRVRQALARHGAGEALTTQLLSTCYDIAADGPDLDPTGVLALALDQVLRFEPLSPGVAERPLMLVGPPGVGKTSLSAKLAARARLGTGSVRVITTDTVRAGGVAQLQAYAQALEIGLQTAKGAGELRALLAASAGCDLVLIDTTGANPFDLDEMAALASLCGAGDIEPMLVFAAGVETVSGIDWAQAFAAIGCSRMVVSKIDIAWRLGGVLDIAHATQLRLAGASVSPRIGNGFDPMTPNKMARWLMAAAPKRPTRHEA